MNQRVQNWIRNHWLCGLIAAQPVLDAVAFWDRNAVATVAGYVRLLILLALPLYLLSTLRRKGRFLLCMAGIGLYCLLHVLNGFRVGYISLYFDLAYLVKVVQMPRLLCLSDPKRADKAPGTDRRCDRGCAGGAGADPGLAYRNGKRDLRQGPRLQRLGDR